ncbi:DUF5719 family protein [Gleimia hominis]|uniref:DUF5719 family protein n=1 Tax=Gleimia hominis TaxID=595468 RepID=UPI000C80EABC|nr:DUF5719 family protein [Gleimia hominis]WIK64766.1 DUF5719 family protein [Gleimia hominis]
MPFNWKEGLKLSALGVSALVCAGALGATGFIDVFTSSAAVQTAPASVSASLENSQAQLTCVPHGLAADGADTIAGDLQVLEDGGQWVDELQTLSTNGPGSQVDQKNAKSLRDPVRIQVRTQADTRVYTSAITQSHTAHDNGLAWSRCGAPTMEGWFAGASTAVGNQSVLVLANPSDAAANVSLQAWTSVGPLDIHPSVVVPKLSSVRVNLASYFPQEEALAVHARVDGPTLGMSLLTTSVAGVAPQGMNATGPAAQLERKLVFPGFMATNSHPRLRLVNPGQKDAVVTVQALTPKGMQDVPGATDLTVDAGAVLELNMDGLPGPHVGITVDSSVPVTGVLTADVEGKRNEDGDAVSDRGVWVPAAASKNLGGLVPDLAGLNAELSLVNPAGEPAHARVMGKPVTVPANSTVTVAAKGNVQVSADRPLFGAVTLTKTGDQPAIASLPLTDPTQLNPPLQLNITR